MSMLDDFCQARGHALQQLNVLLDACQRAVNRSYPPVTHPGQQDGEKAILAELLPEQTGWYLDVGACEPVQLSNTWPFYERGWRGLLIEPLPSHFYALLRQRPGDWLCPLAVTNKKGLARFRVAGSVSSLRPDWAVEEQCELIVETDTLSNILESYPAVRDGCLLASIDVEGMELEVLEGIDWATFRPKVFCIERRGYHPTILAKDISAQWSHLLLSNGYVLHGVTQFNAIYRLPDPVPEPEAPA